MDLPSKSRVNQAGERLRYWWEADWEYDDREIFRADVAVLQAWRSQHAYPIRLCMPSLRNWAQRHTTGPMPVERLKRQWRMVEKLARHPSMKLARMQDIGGARVVASTPGEVERVAAEIQLRTELQHRWAEEVARVDDRLGFSLKDGVGPDELRTYFRMASDLLSTGGTTSCRYRQGSRRASRTSASRWAPTSRDRDDPRDRQPLLGRLRR
jgi:hypothetical protein